MSIYLKSGLLGAALLLCQPVWALDFVPFSHEASVLDKLTLTHTDTPELKPIPSQSFQLAAAQFLPEVQDSEFGFSGNSSNNSHNQSGCSGFALSACPPHGTCSSCALNPNLKKLDHCASGWKIDANTCLPSSCRTLGYQAEIPLNQICDKIMQSGLTCYNNCRSLNCAGYSLNCDSFNVVNAGGKEICADCNDSNANCSPKLCKVKSCMDGYKIADNGTACIELDDTCADGYYKSCETGTQGDPQLTEKGTACYQCKPKTPECDSIYKYNAENCPSKNYARCGQSCGDNYTQCKAKPYTVANGYKQTRFNHGGLSFGDSYKIINRKQIPDCPDAESNLDFYQKFSSTGNIPTSSYDGYKSCYTGEKACLDVYLKLMEEGEVSLEKNINCGNLNFDLSTTYSNQTVKKFIINGNGHTITFSKPSGDDFIASSSRPLNINNVKIIHNNPIPISWSTCSADNNDFVFYSNINATNVDVFADAGLATLEVNFYGTNYFTLGKNILAKDVAYSRTSSTYDTFKITDSFINLFGTLNIRTPEGDDVPQTSIKFSTIGSDAILNFKGYSSLRFSAEGNAKVNLCFTSASVGTGFWINEMNAKKENIRVNRNSIGLIPTQSSLPVKAADEYSVFTQDLCNESIYDGEFWN